MNRLLTSEGWEETFGIRVPADRVASAARAALAWVRAHPAISTGAAWGLITLARLFVGGAVGMADNFDGHRLLCQLGVAPRPIPASQPLWAYVTPTYDSYTWYGEACSAGGTGQPYLSTEYFPLLLAKLLTQLFGLSGALDLRMLGPVFAAGLAVAIGWTVHELPGPRWVAILCASGLGLAAVDSAIAPYYISPFSEPAALLGTLLLIPATLRLLGHERVRARDIALVAALAAWIIGAKTQTASVLVAVVPILLLRPWGRAAGALGRVRMPRRRSGRALLRTFAAVATRLPALAACAVLIGGTVQFELHQSRWLNEIVLYDDVFRDVLGHSSHVNGDLHALGLPADFAGSAGSSIVAPNSAAALPDYPLFLQHASLGKVLTFYAAHPWRLAGVADRGLAGMAQTRPSYLGNYLASSGADPYAKECRVCIAPALFTLTQPMRWVVIPGLWAVALVGGILLMSRRRFVPARARGVGVVLAGTAAATVAQFWAVMLSEGDSDIEKHMVLAVFGTMLLGPLLIAAVAAFDQKRVPASPADADAR